MFGTLLPNSTADTYAVNLTGLDLNNPYTAQIQLNYSTATGNNTGGLASNPGAHSTVGAPPAV